MKNIFLLIILGLFSVNSNSQLQKAKKFAKTITAEELKGDIKDFGMYDDLLEQFDEKGE